MSKVTYDGEEVKFEGAPPKNVGHLIELLSHNAAGQGRVLMSVQVDGRDAMEDGFDMNATSYGQVVALTGTQKELFLKAIDVTLSHLPQADDAIDPILDSLLSDTWQNAFGKLNEFLQKLTGFFELLANLAHYAEHNAVPWKKELAEHLKAIDAVFTKVLKQCETQQVAELTSTLNIELRPIYTETVSLVKDSVRSTFAK